MNKNYLAGIVDGEGSICLTRQNTNSQYRVPIVVVSSTTIELVLALKESYGGCISTKRKKHRSNLPSWTWAVSYRSALKVLKLISPLLLVPKKAARAKFLLSQYHVVTKRNGKYTPKEQKLKFEFEKKFFTLV